MWRAEPLAGLGSLRLAIVRTFAVASGVAVAGEFFGHNNFRAAVAAGHDVEFIHEGAHEKDAAAGSAQKIFFGEGIGHIAEVKALAFIENVNDHFVGSEIEGEINFFVGALLIAVMESVDDPFADGHANAVAVVFAETRGFGYAQTHFLGEVDAVDLRLEGDFEVLRVLRHAEASPAPNEPAVRRLMGNIGMERESMEEAAGKWATLNSRLTKAFNCKLEKKQPKQLISFEDHHFASCDESPFTVPLLNDLKSSTFDRRQLLSV